MTFKTDCTQLCLQVCNTSGMLGFNRLLCSVGIPTESRVYLSDQMDTPFQDLAVSGRALLFFCLSTRKSLKRQRLFKSSSLIVAIFMHGLIQIGGDGLFQEIMNGLLTVRGRKSEDGKAAQRWRVGHVPAGSTDAVAYSINGTRSVVTAVLHIALGDR